MGQARDPPGPKQQAAAAAGPASVQEVRQLVSELRLAGQTRDLLDEVYNRLADEQQLADPDLPESLAQMHRGEYIVRRQPTG
jgi:hypothetical protein